MQVVVTCTYTQTSLFFCCLLSSAHSVSQCFAFKAKQRSLGISGSLSLLAFSVYECISPRFFAREHENFISLFSYTLALCFTLSLQHHDHCGLPSEALSLATSTLSALKQHQNHSYPYCQSRREPAPPAEPAAKSNPLLVRRKKACHR